MSAAKQTLRVGFLTLPNYSMIAYANAVSRLYNVACTLRELGGLPQGLPHPETENFVPLLRVFSSGPFS